ncbi:uncharacterized protein MELLADRAFT_107976 [Melampsora larici-populina 98AG31]|uniref:Uncharacterized protein n=1 Tax=Melampsora larici-populina (strain 98AG31 / pathotype 3-4-7) TaxID=747676 RepID=F4RRK2_MELLP|nr:uncharacterized protein MELLADRAFT_107976 [Melampsora larici-populina 98AG31]EGG05012.1 hypothetical protein MELLADRAFT_107976 [Melampsora larici-populina 98AG31]
MNASPSSRSDTPMNDDDDQDVLALPQSRAVTPMSGYEAPPSPVELAAPPIDHDANIINPPVDHNVRIPHSPRRRSPRLSVRPLPRRSPRRSPRLAARLSPRPGTPLVNHNRNRRHRHQRVWPYLIKRNLRMISPDENPRFWQKAFTLRDDLLQFMMPDCNLWDFLTTRKVLRQLIAHFDPAYYLRRRINKGELIEIYREIVSSRVVRILGMEDVSQGGGHIQKAFHSSTNN